MSASFHPHDDLLMAYGAGSLDEATALLVATHLALCPHCRKQVRTVEAMGGALLDDLPPSTLGDNALAAVMARLQEPVSAAPARPVSPPMPAPVAPAPSAASRDRLLPNPLRSYLEGGLDGLPWKRMGGGIEQAVLLRTPRSKARLYRIGAGVAIPEHGHGGLELTMVLSGGFSDGNGHYLRGDVATMGSDAVHRPVADPGEDCLCLAVTDAPLRLTGLLGRLVTPFLDL